MDGKRRMSKIEIPFHIDKEAEFRFALVLESRSLNAHSLMDSGDEIEKAGLKHIVFTLVNTDDDRLRQSLVRKITKWKEKHK